MISRFSRSSQVDVTAGFCHNCAVSQVNPCLQASKRRFPFIGVDPASNPSSGGRSPHRGRIGGERERRIGEAPEAPQLHRRRVRRADRGRDGPDRRPEHRRGICRGPALGRRGHRSGGAGRRVGSRRLEEADTRRAQRSLSCGSPTRSRRAPRSWCVPSAATPESPSRSPCPRRSLPRSTRSASSPGRRRLLEGRAAGGVHGGPHLLRPSRAGRGVCGGDTVELPVHDGDVEVGAGAGRGQHHGAQAVRTRPPSAPC